MPAVRTCIALLFLPLLAALPLVSVAQRAHEQARERLRREKPHPTPFTFAPAFRNYSTDQGLPNNWVYQVRQDRAGYIWVSTDRGLCRFDGYQFRQFPDTLYSNFTSVLSQAMDEDTLGRIWYVDFQARVFYIENERIVPYQHNDVIQGYRAQFDHLEGLIVSDDGTELWLTGRHFGTLHLWGEGKSELTKPSSGYAIHLWEKNGRFRYNNLMEPGNVQLAPSIAIQTDTDLVVLDRSLFLDVKIGSRIGHGFRLPGGLLLLALSGQLYCFEKGQVRWTCPCPYEVGDILRGRDGSILVGYLNNGGLHRYRSLADLRWGHSENSCLPGRSISTLFQDLEGGYWVGTQQEGIFYCPEWGGGALLRHPLLDGQIVRSVATNGQDRLFAGLQNGEVLSILLKARQITDLSPPGNTYITQVAFEKSTQTLSAGGQVGNFYQQGHWLGHSIVSLPYITGSGRGHYKSPGQNPAIWYTADMHGLCKINLPERRLTDCSQSNGGKATRFQAVRQAPDGRVWAYRYDGLVEWLGDTVLRRPAFAHPALRQVSMDIQYLADSSLVLAPKGHGVVIWKPDTESLTQISQRDGLISDRVVSLHIADDGSIWASSYNGLSHLVPLGGRRYRSENYSTQHGLPSNTVHGVCTLGDEVWVATAKGLFRLTNKPLATAMPAPVFSKIAVNGQPYAHLAALNLPHDSANLSIEYLALHFRSGGNIPYRFRLRGASGDTAWQYTSSRSVNFSNLAPAQYRFEVQAQSEEHSWSATTTLLIGIRPPWWQTGWARALAFCLLAGGGYGYYRRRIAALKHEADVKNQLLQLEQSALQAQMNPHFIFNCLNSIQQFILSNEKEEAARFLAIFAQLVRDTLNASVNGEVTLEDEMRMLNDYLRLERLRFKDRFEYKVWADENLDLFDTALPPSLVQPFVENAILHGLKGVESDGRVEVHFFTENQLLRVRVTDNGTGFQATADPRRRSLGLDRTRKRFALLREKTKVQAIGFEYIENKNKQGTEVLLTLPGQ